MATHVSALVTWWEPMVADCRSAGGLDFYWDAVEQAGAGLLAGGGPESTTGFPVGAPRRVLPYAVEYDTSAGWGFLEAGFYYGKLRVHLPSMLREPADAFLGMLYPEECGLADRVDVDDLNADSGVSTRGEVLYSMRPDTALIAAQRAVDVPWDAVGAVGRRTDGLPMVDERYVPDYRTFEGLVWQQRSWIGVAAESGRGLVVVIS